MLRQPEISSIENSRFEIPAFLLIVVAGLAGNYFKYPVFLNIDFLFGSVFAMLALQFFGLRRGVLAAAIIAAYTYTLWNHPYAIIIMTAEVAVVGLLMKRRRLDMLLADALYWIFVGIPLVYLFYHTVMQTPLSNTMIVLIKQAVNGITNALVARILFSLYLSRIGSLQISLVEVASNAFAFFVLIPALILLAMNSRVDFTEMDTDIRVNVSHNSRVMMRSLENWLEARSLVVTNLAEMATALSATQMQSRLEQAQRSDVGFIRIGLQNSRAVVVAHSPLTDEHGKSNIGKDFSDRLFYKELKESGKLMLSEVVLEKFTTPRPLAVLLAPVVVNDKFHAYIAGVLNLKELQDTLDATLTLEKMYYTLLDKNGNVIASNRKDQTVLKPFSRGKGTLHSLEGGIFQWIPELSNNVSIMERWQNSSYLVESSIGKLAEWKLVMEQPVAPFQKLLYDRYSKRLVMLFLLFMGSLVIAELVGRRTAVTTIELAELSRDMPARIPLNDSIVWPESRISEINRLIVNFREMTEALGAVFVEKRHINEVLEQQVKERTRDLLESEERFKNMFNNHSAVMLLIEPESGFIIDANLAAEKYYGYSHESLLRMNISEINTLTPENIEFERKNALNELRNYFIFPHRLANGEVRTTEVHSTPIKLYDTTILFSIVHDITYRKLAEVELIKAKEAAEAASMAKSRFLAVVAHEFHTPLGLLTVSTDILDRYWDRLSKEERTAQNEQIRSAARQMSQLVSSVLTFNDPGKALTSINRKFLDVGAVCRRIAEDVRVVWGDKHKFRVTIDDDCGKRVIDELLYRRFLENLLTNAFRFTLPGGSVSMTVRRSAGELLIDVSDTGIGIPEGEQKKIFEAFYRCGNVEARRGLGLGLSIAGEALQQMNGSITVESRAGTGTTFRVRLPIDEYTDGEQQ